MSQHDFVVDNGPGATVRIDIQSALQALASLNSGAGAPGTTYAYMLWADTANGVLKMRNGANSAWITVGSLTADFLGLTVPLWGGTVGGTGNAITLTPSPAISGYTTGGIYIFLAANNNSGATTINVSGQGAKTIQHNGAALVGGEIETGKTYALVYDGTNMQMLSPPEKASVAELYTSTNDANFVTAAKLAWLWKKGSDIASAGTLVKPSDANLGRYHVVTGTTTISALWSGEVAGYEIELRFAGALQLTHNATSFINLSNANITTAAGDIARFLCEGSNNWRMVSYQRANGKALVETTQTGKFLDRAYAEYTTNADLSTNIPLDDTTPTSSEGTQVLSATITTTSATQRVRARFQGFGEQVTSGNAMIAALFRGSTCLNVTSFNVGAGLYVEERGLALEFEDSPGSAAAFTYTIRVGAPSGAVRLNGSNSGRYFGGTARATLVLDLIEP